jgi:predicted anti-sigma-YlaC factor YlaD
VTNKRADLKQAVGRLLGPAEPEVGCDVCFQELDRYVELEVAGANADAALPGLRAHLEGCPACREDYASLRALLVADANSSEPRQVYDR